MTWNDQFLQQWVGVDRPAIVTADTEWSGAALVQRAHAARRWLDELALDRGQGVPALLDETPAALALVVGGALAARPIAPLGTRLQPAELASAARALGATGLVVGPEHTELGATVARLSGLEVHALDGFTSTPGAPPVERSDDDVAIVVHTSGTTGAPKAIPVRQGPLAARVRIYEVTMPMGPGDRYCSASPLHHTAGVTMALTALGRGATVIPRPWFSVDGWREAGRLGMTHAMLVPTMIDILIAEGALAAARPRSLQYGAAPVDADTLRTALRLLPDTEFLQIFGQTEVSPLTLLTHADHRRGLDSEPWILQTVGRAVAGVDLRIEEPDDEGIGEIVVRAPHVLVADGDGWRRTGDLGRVDAEGFVSLHGRTHDRIVRGGENIYPVEVERAIASHPAVKEVAVVGVRDRRWGETVKAVVVPADPHHPPALAEVQAHARLHVAPFKVPVTMEVVDELPRTANGKVARRRLVDPTA